MDGELFLLWFTKVFLPNSPADKPRLLIMDNHESHLTLALVDQAKANNVELFCLPPHTTHIYQPLDVGMFRPLKAQFAKTATNLGYANKELIIGKHR
jgi:hypothetical protein